jgi:aspartate/methionine/tyrosine aminotransferase
MFARPRYLQWARRFFGQVRFDLATSGIPALSVEAVASTRTVAPGSDWDAPERLRDAIAAHNDVPREEVAAAFGTTHAIWLACATLLANGATGENRDEVLVETPVYEPLVQIPEGVGAVVRHFLRDPASGYALDPERVARAMTARTRMVVVTNLHNPSGVRAGDDALREAARVADSNGAVLLVDEVYSELGRWVDSGGVFRGSARKLAHNVVAVSSLTKSYGLGAERIGWLLGPSTLVERVHETVVASIGHGPSAHARAGLEGFARTVPLAARARSILAGKRDRVAAWASSRGLTLSAAEDSLFGMVTLPGRGDLTSAIEAGIRDHDVLVAPGAFFGAPNAFRIAWSLPMDALNEGLERLGKALGC